VVDLRPFLKGIVVILGIGNILKSDDGAGPYLINKLKKARLRSNLELLDAGTAPENFTGKIKQLSPNTLIMVDAADFCGKAGEVRVIEEEKLGSVGFTTHNLPLKDLIRFLRVEIPELRVVLIGIQPKKVEFGEELSPEVKSAIDKLCMNFI